jgi:hypothetical protein
MCDVIPLVLHTRLKVYRELEGTIEQLGWWTQAVTMAYEQYIGRPVPGQRPDGTFQKSVSKSTSLGSSVIVTSEPNKKGTASIVAAQLGLATLESNDEARSRWSAIVARFLASAKLHSKVGLTPRVALARVRR